MPGGHNSVYTYGFEEIRHPPEEELEKMIKGCQAKKEDCEQRIVFLTDVLKNIKPRKRKMPKN